MGMADIQTNAEQLGVLQGMLVVASELVRDEPTEEHMDALANAGLFGNVPDGFADEALAKGFSLLGEEITRLSAAQGQAAAEEFGALQREWLRLFAGVGQPQVPSWANFYLDPESRVLGRESLAVRDLYAKYGIQIERKGTEPDDDLGLMLRFLAHLAGLQRAGTNTQADQALLLREHVLPWLSAWRHVGMKHATSSFYQGVVEFTFGLVRTYAAHLGFSYKEDTRSFMEKGQQG